MARPRSAFRLNGDEFHLEAPGLKIEPNRPPTWRASLRAVRAGYRPKTVQLNYDLTSRSSIEAMAARCRDLWKEMNEWLADEHKPEASIYFVEMEGFIKIGFTRDWKHREIYFQSNSPFEAKLLHLMPATRAQESALHKRFAHLRARGEWFRSDPEILEFIESVRPK